MVFECLPRFKVAFTTLSTAILAKEKCFAEVEDNGKQGKFERFVQSQYTLAEKCFSRNKMYIPPMSESSLWLLSKALDFWEIIILKSAPTCETLFFICFTSFSMFIKWYWLKGFLLRHCVVFFIILRCDSDFWTFFARAYFRPDFAAIGWTKFVAWCFWFKAKLTEKKVIFK